MQRLLRLTLQSRSDTWTNMAKSNSRRQKSGKVIAGGRVTGTREVTRAGALGKGDLREDLETPRQRKLSNTIRHPYGLV
jgi:hypothetical protein